MNFCALVSNYIVAICIYRHMSYCSKRSAGTEIACNLLGGDESLHTAASQRMEELCGPPGFRIVHSYRIGQSPEGYIKLAEEMLG